MKRAVFVKTWPARVRVSRARGPKALDAEKRPRSGGATMAKTNLRFPDFRADAPDEARHDYSGIISRVPSCPFLLFFSLSFRFSRAQKRRRTTGGRYTFRANIWTFLWPREEGDRDWGRRNPVRDIVSGRLADRDNRVTLSSLLPLPPVCRGVHCASPAFYKSRINVRERTFDSPHIVNAPRDLQIEIQTRRSLSWG